ncbi:MAG TPA: VCBS domain-containing protein, partial [Burkholderiaceae bacterium]|nr:VCBS domain-containing protein [Burkholderiaceae bacterium]
MADNNGVSMSNTPQARDDVWSVAEDDATTFISIAALLANDLGGNAKSFYGINQSNPLLPSMTAQSALGATLSVSSGNIVYTPGNLFQYLAHGATATDTFQYAIQLGNGTISIAKVTVTITGANDAPVVTVEDLQGAVTELTTAPSGNLTDSGSIGFSDLDLADVHSLSAVTSSAGALGTLTVTLASDTTGTGTGGKIDWAY